MNHNIVQQIRTLTRDLTNNYTVPLAIKSNIIYLNNYANEWSALQTCFRTPDLNDYEQKMIANIEKIIMHLVIKFSNCTMPLEMITQLSEIVVTYTDNMASQNKSADELANLLSGLMMGKNLEEEMAELKI